MMRSFRVGTQTGPEPVPHDSKRLSRLWGLWFALLICVSGCATGMNSGVQKSAPASDEALLSIYLETQGFCSSDISFTLKDFVLHTDQEQVPLFLEPVVVVRRQVQDQQIFLGLATVPEGYYGQLDMTLVVGSAAGSESAEQTVTIRLPKTVALDNGESQCLFVTWHLTDCVSGEGRFIPKFSARGQGQPLAGDLLYILCDQINTLYLARTDTRFVVAAIGLDGQAGEMGIDAQRQRLYLVNRSQRSLQVFDLATHRLVDHIPLPLTLKPAYLALDVENNAAFVSDVLSRRVVKIDLETGQMMANQQVGLRPGRLVYIEQGGSGLVAVCAPMTQNVFLLNSETLAVQRTLETGLQPNHVLYIDGRLLIAEEGSQTVTTFDVANGQRLGQVRLIGKPGELLANADNGKVYVSNPQTSSLGVLGVGQFSSLRNIPSGVGPAALAMSERRGMIYVANPAAEMVTVLDRTSERVVGTISLGGGALDLAVYE
jgi:DNA-binding beta-propeller fold protein YncE